jgi:hypothetical protein
MISTGSCAEGTLKAGGARALGTHHSPTARIFNNRNPAAGFIAISELGFGFIDELGSLLFKLIDKGGAINVYGNKIAGCLSIPGIDKVSAKEGKIPKCAIDIWGPQTNRHATALPGPGPV